MTELNMLYRLLDLNQLDMKRMLTNLLKQEFNKNDLIITNKYLFCKGDYPILLVAHMDTVYDHEFYSCYGNDFAKNQTKKKIFYDKEERVL